MTAQAISVRKYISVDPVKRIVQMAEKNILYEEE